MSIKAIGLPTAAFGLLVSTYNPPLSAQVGFIPLTSHGLMPCDKNMAEPNTVVRIKIPKGIRTTKKTRFVKSKTSINKPVEDDEEAYDESIVNASAIPEFKTNPFHMDLSTINSGGKDEYLKVRVFLDDKKYTFYPEERSPTNVIQGVVYDEGQPYGDWFCQKPKAISLTDKNGKSVVTFYVKRKVVKPDIASINIIIIADPAKGAKGGFTTPILIDPKIKNDG